MMVFLWVFHHKNIPNMPYKFTFTLTDVLKSILTVTFFLQIFQKYQYVNMYKKTFWSLIKYLHQNNQNYSEKDLKIWNHKLTHLHWSIASNDSFTRVYWHIFSYIWRNPKKLCIWTYLLSSLKIDHHILLIKKTTGTFFKPELI